MTEICAYCKKPYPRSELIEFDGLHICPACMKAETVVCRSCGRRFWRNGDDGERLLCHLCRKDFHSVCASCGSRILKRAAYYVETDLEQEYPLCWVCFKRWQGKGVDEK